MNRPSQPPAREDTFVLEAYLQTNPNIVAILDRVPDLHLPNWYVGAGCIAQTVWNVMHGFAPTDHIRDYDLAYFDDSDTSYEAEDVLINRVSELFRDLPVAIDLHNQARVHLWYEDHFGYAIKPYLSAEDAIATWPTTASAIGVRRVHGTMRVHAPFGLDDLLQMIARPNKRQVTRDIYMAKVSRWQRCWPRLKVIAWD